MGRANFVNLCALFVPLIVDARVVLYLQGGNALSSKGELVHSIVELHVEGLLACE